MKKQSTRRRRLFGGGLYIVHLLIGSIVGGALSNLPSVAATLAFNVVGGLLTFLYVHLFHGLKVREFDRVMWISIGRLVLSNVAAFGFVAAIQRLGLGFVVTMAACGSLCVGLRKVIRSLREERAQNMSPGPIKAWGRKHLTLRALALMGVLVIVQPWKGLEQLDLLGLSLAALVAVQTWNLTSVLYGPLATRDTRAGLAMSGLISIPVLAGVGYFFGGWAEMSWNVFVIAGTVGLSYLIPVLLAHQIARMVENHVVAVLATLQPIVAGLVGAIGAGLGLLSDVQRPNLWVWTGMGLTVAASLWGALLGEKPSINRFGLAA